jgi:hypothetical protein
MTTRQRSERSDASLTYTLDSSLSSWSISFTLTLTDIDVAKAQIGQSFGFIGFIDQDEEIGTGYPGTTTGLYLPVNTPPRFYDCGKGGPSLDPKPVMLNQSSTYTFTSIEGELWVRFGNTRY